jgi:hypothetical protein
MSATARRIKERIESKTQNPLQDAKPPVAGETALKAAKTPESKTPTADPKQCEMWAAEIKTELGKTNRAALKVGKLLDERITTLGTKANISLFVTYLPFSRQQAYRYRNVYKHFHDAKNLDNYELTALYKLSQDLCPDQARIDAAKEAETKYVTSAKAADLVTKYRGGTATHKRKLPLRLTGDLATFELTLSSIHNPDAPIDWEKFLEAINVAKKIVAQKIKNGEKPDQQEAVEGGEE